MQQDLAQPISAGSVVVTPNRRLAAELRRQYDFAQLRAGRTVWPTADCLSLAAFLERLYTDLTRFSADRTLLRPEQEAALWERVVAASSRDSPLIDSWATARAAREAWGIEHAYLIDLARHRSVLDENARVYAAWSAEIGETLRRNRWVDAAQLPAAIVGLLEQGARLAPRVLVLYGFDQLAPQMRTVVHALAQCGWQVAEKNPVRRESVAQCVACDDRETEIATVAEEIRAAFEAGEVERVGVVAPDLAALRADIVRIFDDVFDPRRIVSGSRGRSRPFNVSLGAALHEYPLVHTALLVLDLARGELALEDMGSLLRSPFLAGSEQEFAGRALLDARLRRDRRPVVPLATLARCARGDGTAQPAAVPTLAARLDAWRRVAAEARRLRQAPSQWCRTFQALLSGLGWPGERTLDSDEYQTFAKWREAVSTLSALDLVTPHLGFDEALSCLKRLVSEIPFQPETGDVPVQVLGVLEAHGLEFDRLFVVGMTDEVWPPAPRPNPFLPHALQRAHRVPHATADWQLDFARRTLYQWCGAAPHVRFSWPCREGDRELNASPLLRNLGPGSQARRGQPRPCELIYAARAVETLSDFCAPHLPEGVAVPGGATFFQNQAACPFRAFAVHRLGARALDAASVGLDAMDRGWLVHRAAEHVWNELRDSARLHAETESGLRAIVDRAVSVAVEGMRRRRPDVMTERFAPLEHERIAALLMRLLELEKQRVPFSVLGSEEPQPIRVAGVEVSTRLDRVDRLVGGGEVILDYKTSGEVDASAWLGERPDEPQLPLYAAARRQPPAAVAFVQLHARQVRFEGLSSAEGLLPGVPALAGSKKAAAFPGEWRALLESWRDVLEHLARAFLSGRAAVDPKRYPQTCQFCDLGVLCRVQELKDRGPVAAGEGDGN